MTSAVLVPILRAVLLLGSILMVLKLYRTRLYRVYPVFFAFFIFRIPNSIWPIFLATGSKLYFYFWVYTDPIGLAFYVFMVVELYRSVLEGYKGLYSLGRWVMYISVPIAVTVSALTLLPTITPQSTQGSRRLVYLLATERGVDTALAVFIILMLCFLSFFPLRLGRNVRVHALVFSVFFLSNTFVLIMRTNFGVESPDWVNTSLLCLTAASVVAWLVLLRSTGEDLREAPAAAAPEYESRLLAHLDSLNAALLKTAEPDHVTK